jgi:hypothetical protein
MLYALKAVSSIDKLHFKSGVNVTGWQAFLEKKANDDLCSCSMKTDKSKMDLDL